MGPLLAACLVLMVPPTAQSYRILGFHPIPGKSQHNVFAPILHQLAIRGHSVVYVTPVPPDLSHPNLEVRLIPQYKEHFHRATGLGQLGDMLIPLAFYMLYSAITEMAPHMYGVPTVQALIHSRNETFDAVTMESYVLQEPVSAFLHKFSCPAIEISTFGDFAWLNELAEARTSLTAKMTFWERLYNFYATWSSVLVSYYFLSRQQGTMDQYFNYTGWESRPPINRLLSNRSIILVNQDPVLGDPQPLSPQVKNIGGVNLLPRKPLPQDLKKWMDSATNGVIYFSLGSNIKTSEVMGTKLGETFVKVFQELPQRIVMKWEKDELPQGFPSNILFYKWIPQQDLLAHKNCCLFITHGGFLSLTEAVYHGVPLLGIPFFWDQPKNMLQAERAAYGLRLERDNITFASVHWAVQELLKNKRYKEEAMKRSRILRDRKDNPLDEAVYWIEHAIKYPNSLRPHGADLNFFQLHLIDIKLFILFVLFVLYKAAKYLVLKIKVIQCFKAKKKLIDCFVQSSHTLFHKSSQSHILESLFL